MSDLDKHAEAAFRDAQEQWRVALEGHRTAPPDAGFSARLGALGDAARAEGLACRAAHDAGFEWPPHRAASSKPPWELQPGSGRRGPQVLWRRFDAAVAELNRAATGSDLVEVAGAYVELAAGSGGLVGSGRARGPSVGIASAATALGVAPRAATPA